MEESGNYGWEEIEFGGSAPANMVTTDTAQTITGTKTIPTLNTTNLTALGETNNLATVKCLDYNENALQTVETYKGIEISRNTIGYGQGINMPNYSKTAFLQFSPVSTSGNLLGSAEIIFYSRNNNNSMVRRFSTGDLQICLTGDSIIAKINNNSFIGGQVVTCVADSTDANASYKANHIYRLTYSNDTWTATDITPSAPIVLENVSASTWVADNTYAGYGYKCEISVNGVTDSDLAEVVFGVAEATSGNYAPVAVTDLDTVTIYSKVDTAITIPTIKVDRL